MDTDRPDPRPREGLEEIEHDAGRLAEAARGMAEQSRGTALTGERPELDPRAPPRLDIRHSGAVHRADRVRAEDDVRTGERQEELAAAQEEAARTLRESREALEAGRAELDATGGGGDAG